VNVRGTVAPRIRSTWGRSQAWEGSISRPSSIPLQQGGVCKLYDRKTPVTATDLLNDRVLPFLEQFEISLLRLLTDRGTEYCGNPQHHGHELYMALEDIDHTRPKAQSPHTNGISERFHKTILNEFHRVTFRKKLHKTIEELQADLDQRLKLYNEERTHQDRWRYGMTSMQSFIDSVPLAKEKMLAT